MLGSGPVRLAESLKTVGVGLVGLGLLGACDDPPPKEKASPAKTVEPPALEPPKPSGPPGLEIDDISAKVGFSRVLLQKPDGVRRLQKELHAQRKHFENKTAELHVVRKANMKWVMTFVAELGAIKVKDVKITTDTRKGFPKQLTLHAGGTT